MRLIFSPLKNVTVKSYLDDGNMKRTVNNENNRIGMPKPPGEGPFER